ncbi:DUF4097 family beta strand repeat-containing protein [Halobacterium wangiae]|uniref:DUF4097 family beta strand repeat-containing protein n=1 Tax=Halobacterium wangiae TaxID=2902623 RepID=UPI001E60D6B3|nr:DUF4097 family beta strand repeat-containing protein [Halobacterium wangiae]
MIHRRALLASVTTGVTAALAGCTGLFGDEVVQNDSHTYDVSGDDPLAVRNRNGDVSVERHDGSQVEVDVEMRGPSEDAVDSVSVSGEQRDDAFVVDVRGDGSSEWWTSVSVDLSVRVPGSLPVETVRTTNGDVDVNDVAGAGAFHTMNGGVTVRGVEAFASAVTTNGDVNVDVPAPLDGDATIETENGDVDASLSQDLDATVSATTTNGSVEVHELDMADADVSGRSVSGTLGEGTYDLSVETTNGDVDLRALEE